ncbi:MAG: hypothetical protein AAF633_14905 [Chloroflexota bacterium]
MKTMLHVVETYEYSLLLGDHAQTKIISKRGWIRLNLMLSAERFGYLLDMPGPNHLGDLYFLIPCPADDPASFKERHGFALALPPNDALAADLKKQKELRWHFLYAPEVPHQALVRAEITPVSELLSDIEVWIRSGDGPSLSDGNAVELNAIGVDCTWWIPTADQLEQAGRGVFYDREKRQLLWSNVGFGERLNGWRPLSLRCPIPSQRENLQTEPRLTGSATVRLRNTLGSGRKVILRPTSESHSWIEAVPTLYTTELQVAFRSPV